MTNSLEKDHPLKEGDSIQGIFKGVPNYGSNDSNVWHLEVQGETFGVWGSTVIDEHMKDIAEGTEVGIEFGGMADSVKRPGKRTRSSSSASSMTPSENRRFRQNNSSKGSAASRGCLG